MSGSATADGVPTSTRVVIAASPWFVLLSFKFL